MGRAEDFFRDVERRYGTKIRSGAATRVSIGRTARRRPRRSWPRSGPPSWRPVRRSSSRCGTIASSPGRQRCCAPADPGRCPRRDVAGSAAVWGAYLGCWPKALASPTSRQTVAQWDYKKRFIDAGAAAARDHLSQWIAAPGPGVPHRPRPRGLQCRHVGADRRRRVPGGAAKSLSNERSRARIGRSREWRRARPVREVPPLGYWRSPKPTATPGHPRPTVRRWTPRREDSRSR